MHWMVDDDDWRLTNQESYLTGVRLRWSQWSSFGTNNDHDHCEFCWAEFAAVKTDHVDYTAGFVTDDNYHWVCRACFEDIRERFRWVVNSPPATGG